MLTRRPVEPCRLSCGRIMDASQPDNPGSEGGPAGEPPRSLVRSERFRVVVGVALTVLVSALLYGNARVLIRSILQLGLVAALVWAALSIPKLWGRRRELAVSALSLLLCVGLIQLFEPVLVRALTPSLVHLEVDQRDPGCMGCNEDDVILLDPTRPVAEEDFNIVFLGDSFTQGHGVDPTAETFTARIELALRGRPGPTIRAINMGWTGSSPVTHLRRFDELGARYRPDLVIHSIDMTDFLEDQYSASILDHAGLRRPRDLSVWRVLSARAGLLFLGRVDPGNWLREQVRFLPPPTPSPAEQGLLPGDFFVVRQPLADSRPWLEVTWKTLLATAEASEELGAKYLIFVLPRYQQYDRSESPEDWERGRFPATDDYLYEPFVWFEEQARTVDFPIRSLLEDFQRSPRRPTTLHDDPHWNATGHAIAAEAMLRMLDEEGVLPGG